MLQRNNFYRETKIYKQKKLFKDWIEEKKLGTKLRNFFLKYKIEKILIYEMSK